MKKIESWSDLEPYGIIPLTGESCGLGYRILCDVTERGRRVLAKTFGITTFTLAENWNRGHNDDPHVGSIMLAPEMLVPIAMFALLDVGCLEVWVIEPRRVVGIASSDSSEAVEAFRQDVRRISARRLAPHGTAGDRNIHVMSGRIE
jgi:hypothetical protein